MDENPYKALCGELNPFRQQRPTWGVWLVRVASVIGIAFAIMIVAAIVVFFTFPFFVDIRENPRYWDEIERREKTSMSEEEATESLSVDKAAGRWP